MQLAALNLTRAREEIVTLPALLQTTSRSPRFLVFSRATLSIRLLELSLAVQ